MAHRFRIVTLFPDFFQGPLDSSLLGKARARELLDIEVVDLRLYSEDRLGRCDDYPYGGGSGMVIKPEPLYNCMDAVCGQKTRVVLTTPSGRCFDQELARELAQEEDICLVCGHYEGVDQRFIDKYVDLELSIGDYVLSGGEYASLVIVDCISRLVPGFMSNSASLDEESFENGLLEYPHYTRPAEFRGQTVPDVLLSGNHGAIRQWRLEQSIDRTRRIRPDLFARYKND
jgi:tRNA (guanine37-N1)-methyltransferase